MNLEDVDLAAGSTRIRRGGSRKPRLAYVGRRVGASHAYLKLRGDANPAPWRMGEGDSTTYAALGGVVRHRATQAGLERESSLHDFRRAFAINMLRSGVDVFALQRLMRHADLRVLRRYLTQTDADIRAAHMRGRPVDNNL